jgi:hypothetical protein
MILRCTRRTSAGAVLFGILLASCSLPPAATSGSATATEPPPTPQAKETSSPIPSPVASLPSLPEGASILSDPSQVPSYLDQGGDLQTLLDHFTSAGLFPSLPPSLPYTRVDIDGDGVSDLAFSLQDLTAPPGPRPPGSFFVWVERPEGYALVFRTQPETEHSAPVIVAAQDLTRDAGAEIVIGRPACGAHTCFLALGVLTWDGRQVMDVFRGTSEDLATPSVVVRAPDSSTAGSIQVTSAGVQSVGAGPPRPRTRTWTWDPASKTFVPGPDALAAPRYRIHVVHDADAAFEAGRYDEAAGLYGQALADQALLDWDASPATPATLKAYVHYRLVLLDLVQRGSTPAQAALNAMVEATAGVPEAEPFVTMAQLLIQAPEPFDLAVACDSVRQFAANHKTEVLDALYYGYDNRIYTPADLCPWA